MELKLRDLSAPTELRFAVEPDDYVLKIRRSDYDDLDKVRFAIYGGSKCCFELFVNEVDGAIIGVTVVSCERSYSLPAISKHVERDAVPAIDLSAVESPIKGDASAASFDAGTLRVYFQHVEQPLDAYVCGALTFYAKAGVLVGFDFSGDLTWGPGLPRLFGTNGTGS